MSDPQVALVAALTAAVLVLVIALGSALVRPRMWRLRPTRGSTGLEAYVVRTPIGTVAVTRVLHPDRGESFQITSPRHLHPIYTAPSLQVALDRIRALTDETAQEAPR